jgi:parvulin-like peptidyl-prolyl isomerase
MPHGKVVLFLALSALASACGNSSTDGSGTTSSPTLGSSDDIGAVIATVNGVSVGERSLQDFALRNAPAGASEITDEVRQEVLDDVLTDEVLFQEAFARGLYQDPKVRTLMINFLLREEVYGNISGAEFSNEEAEAYFKDHKDEFTVPAKLQVKRIFIKVGDGRSSPEAKSFAEELHAKIVANPDSFSDLAAEHSEDPYKRRGGDLGYLSSEGKPGVEAEVIKRAFEMNVGEISEVFLAGTGYHIVHIAAKRDALERTFEQMKGSVLRRLKNERYEEMTETFIDDLKSKYPIEIDEAALATVQLDLPKRPSGLGGLDLFEMDPMQGGDKLQELMKQHEAEMQEPPAPK